MKKMNILIVLSFFVLYNSCSFSQNIDSCLLSCATNYFYNKAKPIFRYMKDSSAEYVKSKTLFVRKIPLPFKEYDFYLYDYKGMEPSWSAFLVHDRLSNKITILDTLRQKGDSYPIYSSLLEEINIFLKKDPVINKLNILDFSKFLLFVSFPIENGFIILNNWKGIKTKDKENIPNELKRQIDKPFIQKESDVISVIFYCWNRFDGKVYQLKIKYQEKELVINSLMLGEYGEKIIIL